MIRTRESENTSNIYIYGGNWDSNNNGKNGIEILNSLNVKIQNLNVKNGAKNCININKSNVEIDNIMPIIINRKHIMRIIDGAIFHAFTCAFISTLFLCINKDKIVDKEKYNKTFIICYLVASLALTLVMFFILSCFGYNMSTLFRFPEYILLKKIEISNTGLHLENLLAFRWLFYMIALGNIVTYNIICIIKSFSSKEKLSNYIVIFICLLCLFISKMIFYNVPSAIRNIKLYYVPYVALPLFILLTITYILCLFKKRESH